MAFHSRLLSYTCSDAYSFRNGYPLSTYIETLIITVEACGVLLLVAHFQRRLDAAFAGALPALPLRSPDIDPSPKRKPLVPACCVHSIAMRSRSVPPRPPGRASRAPNAVLRKERACSMCRAAPVCRPRPQLPRRRHLGAERCTARGTSPTRPPLPPRYPNPPSPTPRYLNPSPLRRPRHLAWRDLEQPSLDG